MSSGDDEEMRIITGNWTRLAALAWQGYSEEGRGFVALEPAGGEIKALYLAEGSPQFEQINGQFSSGDLTESVSTYDPREGAVFVFIRPGELSFCDVEQTPSPPAAWQLLWSSKLESSKPN